MYTGSSVAGDDIGKVVVAEADEWVI